MWQVRLALAITDYEAFNGVESMCRVLEMYDHCGTGAALLDHTLAVCPDMQHICLIIRHVYAVMDMSILLYLVNSPLSGALVSFCNSPHSCSNGGHVSAGAC
jgi:hypothetical protein